MKRKLVSVLLSVVLMVSCAFSASAAFTDVTENTKYGEAVEVLVALGLLKGYEDNTFRPDNTITRAEFATVITRMLGLENVVAGASAANVFSDMKVGSSEHWASGYIKIAYDLGIILGMGDGTFAPDNPVTYEQVVKMLVCALGYEAAATELGGWPDGYIAQGDSLGILKGLAVEKTSMSASRAMVAQLLYNALDVHMAEKKYGGSVEVTDKTVLTSKLGCVAFNNCMISQVDDTDSITDNGIRLRNGELAFAQSKDPFIYTSVMEKLEAKALLGNYVKGYYKLADDDNEPHTLIYIEPAKNKSEETIVLSENIESYDNFVLSYYADEDDSVPKKIEIDAQAQLLYNGSIYDYVSGSASERDLSKWLDPENTNFLDGQIRLLENTGDKKVDTVFIEDYETYVAKSRVMTNDSISSNNYVIYDNYVSGKNIRIDPYSPSVTAEFYNGATGEEMSIEDIKAMHIISVAANMAKTKFKVYISNNTVTGKIDEFGTENEYVIDGKSYVTTQTYEEIVAAGIIQPKIGLKGTFYLDHNGRVCAAKITQEDAGAYAYVTNAGIDNDRAIIKLINLSGTPTKPTKVKCAKTVKINGRTSSEPQDVLDVLEETAPKIASNADATNATYAQLIRYVKNTAGEITKITTVSMQGNTVKVGKNEDTDKLVTGEEKTQYTYSSSSGFESKVFVNSKTLVLVVPNDRQDDEEYKRSTATAYFKTGTRYNLEAYDINNSTVATVVLVYNADEVSLETAVDYTVPVCIVSKVSKRLSTVNEDDLVYSIEVYENGKTKMYETENDSATYANIKVGDVIRFGLNSDGQINKLGRANTGTHELDVNALVPEFGYDKSLHNSHAQMYNEGEYFFKTIYGTVSSIADESVFIAPTLVDTTGEIPALDTSAAVGFKLSSAVYKYHVRLTDRGTEVNVLSDLNLVIEFGDLKNANATHMFAQAYCGTLKVLVVVVDERTVE